MPRIRTIKPEFYSSPGIETISPWARLLYIAMWNWADDAGRGTCNLLELRGFAFPYDEATEDVGTSEGFRRVVAEVRDHFEVTFYKVDGRPYYAIPTWKKHQRIERTAQARYPAPEEGEPWDPSPTDQRSDGTSDNLRPPATELATVSKEAPTTSGTGTGEVGTGEQGKLEEGTGETNPSGSLGGASAARAPARAREPSKAKSTRGTRLPADFSPTDAMAAWVSATCPGVDWRRANEKFVNYWTAKTGAQATKLDWPATWRNWMLSEQERAERFAPRPSSLQPRISAADRSVAEAELLKDHPDPQFLALFDRPPPLLVLPGGAA